MVSGALVILSFIFVIRDGWFFKLAALTSAFIAGVLSLPCSC